MEPLTWGLVVVFVLGGLWWMGRPKVPTAGGLTEAEAKKLDEHGVRVVVPGSPLPLPAFIPLHPHDDARGTNVRFFDTPEDARRQILRDIGFAALSPASVLAAQGAGKTTAGALLGPGRADELLVKGYRLFGEFTPTDDEDHRLRMRPSRDG